MKYIKVNAKQNKNTLMNILVKLPKDLQDKEKKILQAVTVKQTVAYIEVEW